MKFDQIFKNSTFLLNLGYYLSLEMYVIPLETAKDKLQNAYKNRITGNNWKYVMTWTLRTLLIEIFRFFFLIKWEVDKKGFPIVCSEFNSLSEKKV